MPTTFPDAHELESVLDLAARAPSAGNAQPWRWTVDQHGVQLLADWTRSLGDTDSDRRDVLLSCGAVLHHCAVAFAAAGWSSRIVRFPADDVLAAFELAKRPPGTAAWNWPVRSRSGAPTGGPTAARFPRAPSSCS